MITTIKDYANKALFCLDLTSLSEKDNEETIKALCDKAVGRYGSVAAVCIFPQFVSLAKSELHNSDVKVATVINFPKGEASLDAVIDEAKEALDFGADEIDMVFPYKEFLAGNRTIGKDIIQAVKEICAKKKLKVIIETGALQKTILIANATKDCITAGADFIKTSTGMINEGATPNAANAILEVINNSRKKVGFKASGGIKNIQNAKDYIVLANSIMGKDYIDSATFRIGASKLIDEIIKELGY